MNAAALILATGFGSGFFPLAPATLASALATLLVWFVWPEAPLVEGLIVIVLLPVAFWTAGVAEKKLGHDARPIVIDEVVGQLIALWAVPKTATWMLAGLILFRLFDIWKPLGARDLQSLPGGFGVVADDVLAGIYAWLVLQAAYQWGPAMASFVTIAP